MLLIISYSKIVTLIFSILPTVNYKMTLPIASGNIFSLNDQYLSENKEILSKSSSINYFKNSGYFDNFIVNSASKDHFSNASTPKLLPHHPMNINNVLANKMVKDSTQQNKDDMLYEVSSVDWMVMNEEEEDQSV